MSKLLGPFVLVVTVVTAQSSFAAEPAAADVSEITVGEMCGGCVKKIIAKLKPMSGIVDVTCDLAQKTVTVTPAAAGISPRALWDMEQIGKTPVKLVTPSGTFAQKPAN